MRERGETYVCNSQRSQVVLFVLAAHLLATSSSTLPQMRGHVAGRSTTETTLRRLVGSRTVAPSGRLVDGRHGILERTARGKVLSAADPTLDLLVLELILHAALLATFLLCLCRLRLPVHARPEGDVLTHRGRLE